MSPQYPNVVLQVFARAPTPGDVKTRLIPRLGADGAARFYAQMCEAIVKQFTSACLCPLQLWCSPSIQDPFFINLQQTCKLQLHEQRGEDLGERMSSAIQQGLAEYESAILIGTDCPSMTPEYIEQAIMALSDRDIVIGPALDGGYVLIGMKNHLQHLFSGIDWGHSTVLDKTIKIIRNHAYRYSLLSPLPDIDTPDDVDLLGVNSLQNFTNK